MRTATPSMQPGKMRVFAALPTTCKPRISKLPSGVDSCGARSADGDHVCGGRALGVSPLSHRGCARCSRTRCGRDYRCQQHTPTHAYAMGLRAWTAHHISRYTARCHTNLMKGMQEEKHFVWEGNRDDSPNCEVGSRLFRHRDSEWRCSHAGRRNANSHYAATRR